MKQGVAQLRGIICDFHPAAPGSNLTTPDFFIEIKSEVVQECCHLDNYEPKKNCDSFKQYWTSTGIKEAASYDKKLVSQLSKTL